MVQHRERRRGRSRRLLSIHGTVASRSWSAMTVVAAAGLFASTLLALSWLVSGPSAPSAEVGLVLRDVDSGRVVLRRSVAVGEPFALEYTHSVHRTPMRETFHIDASGRIVLDQLRYESLGVGNPSEAEGAAEFRLEDGSMILDRMNRVLGTFQLAVGQVAAGHRLIVQGDSIPLASLGRPGIVLRFEVKKTLSMKLKGVLNVDR
ncbi:DUF1850 domain-containing protein [Paenibacillus sp. YYML68]|uniref:DUF1850 domain-containing protein n=1 Tax=Paenibacillus sp. YYML68 TaxID=2909250 RepID=UPI002492F208|nr:DUF1850 domain-containing protein [Paenibacillus sp. YYML68]